MSKSLFFSNLPANIRNEAKDPIAARLLTEYGSIFVARGRFDRPQAIIFPDETAVENFQASLKIGKVEFDDISIELQKAAAEALDLAVENAKSVGLSITPRSADSGRRSYSDTVELWRSRVEPALEHWVNLGKLSLETANGIRTMAPFEQVPVVFELEQRGLWFSKDLLKSIIYSVAPPGASQHLSMLAFDAAEFNDPQIRAILAEHFWYQTVVSDLPHFTYLGMPERELSQNGLKKDSSADRVFWLPDL